MRLARRQRIEGGETLEFHGRDDRLQTKDVDWIAAMADGRWKSAGIRGRNALVRAGEPQSTQGGTHVIMSRVIHRRPASWSWQATRRPAVD